MRIPDLAFADVRRAADGDVTAMDALLRAIESGVFNLSLRMLGNRDDAADASQEILLKVVTHLGGFRGEAAFSTWVYRIARHHLLNAVTRTQEAPQVSFESIADKLGQGMAYGRSMGTGIGAIDFDAGMLAPEEKVEAVAVALSCTQGMLMALDRDQRLAYLLDVIFGLTSDQAGEVVGITAAAFRKRLSRARERLAIFMQGRCGLVNPDAPCRCPQQLPAVRARRAVMAASGDGESERGRATPDRDDIAGSAFARSELARWQAFGDAAAVFRGHPEYRAPEELLGAIRALLVHRGYLQDAMRTDH